MEKMVSKIEIVIFCEHFLNKDISFPITDNSLKCLTCINEMWMEGSVSQNFDIGLRFNLYNVEIYS